MSWRNAPSSPADSSSPAGAQAEAGGAEGLSILHVPVDRDASIASFRRAAGAAAAAAKEAG